MAPHRAADLLHGRWMQIQEAYDEADFSRMKEAWWIEAFELLENAPKEEHCWCTHGKIMDPLLEPFYHFFEESQQFQLHKLWQRLCSELNGCTTCVHAYHDSKERYFKAIDEAFVERLLTVLQILEEERVATHLQTLMHVVRKEKFDSRKHATKVITVLYEVLNFPSFLEDAEVSERFAQFLLFVEETHDLALLKGPQYPGVYTLLVHSDSQVRRVALTLVQSLEKIKDAHEMEAIAPLVDKIMNCLEFEDFERVGQKKVTVGQKEMSKSPHGGTSRPRTRFRREALWRGLVKILERLQPAALEEGIVERYSVFVSIVLNHVSEYDESVFFEVLKCLEILLSKLGYNFWLRTTFSAGVVRNTLVSQCFHSNVQRMHTSIFELFPPFLLSLETLQIEYERQRRRLLYFLLQQVPASKNFNSMMRSKARQVSFKIICSGYTMEPPLPPWECAHVWGPPLVETLKDPNMHPTFRPAAFDLIQTILAADTSALASFSLKSEAPLHPWSHLLENGDTESGHEMRVTGDGAQDQKYWKTLKKVSAIMSEGLEKWSCVPLLWIEVLGGVLEYPTSFYKSVLWAFARVSIVDLAGDTKVLHPEVDSKVLRWESPRGYDDECDSDACANVVPIQQDILLLISSFKRYADGFLDRSGEVFYTLSLEPWLAEPLLLLLMNGNINWKVVAQKVLSRSGASSSLVDQLKLLYNASASAVGDAVRHASRMLLCWPLENSERALSQLFFLGLKLLSLDEGGPTTSSSPASREFCESVSTILWPLIGRTIMESKSLTGSKHELMLTRMFMLLPSVCKRMPKSFWDALFGVVNPKRNNINWFRDLLALGNLLASRAVLRWWQIATIDVLQDLVKSGSLSPALKDIISAFLMAGCPLEKDQQQRLKLLMESAPAKTPLTIVGPTAVIDLDSDDENAQYAHRPSRAIEEIDQLDVIDLERLDHITSALNDVTVEDHKELAEEGKEEEMEEAVETEEEEEMDEEEVEEIEDPTDTVPIASLILRPQPAPSPHIVHPPKKKAGVSKFTTLDKYVYKTPNPPIGRPVQKKRSSISRPRALPSLFKNQGFSSLKAPAIIKEPVPIVKQPVVAEPVQKPVSKPQVVSNQDTLPKVVPEHAATRDKAVLRELVMDDDNDDFGKALNEAVRKRPEKRQVMTLQMPGEQMMKPGPLARSVPERAPPPKLDIWFRQILSMDYFTTVGLECLWVEDRHETGPLPKVPTSFPSVQKYRDTFTPLLLEEFKAQLMKSFGEMSYDRNSSAVLRLMSLERVDDFQIGRFLADGGEDATKTWKENDLLLLTRFPLEPKEPQSCHLLAKVDRKEREFKGTATTFLIKVCLPPGSSRLQNAKKHLTIRSKWHVTKVMNMVSQIREFQALSAVGNFPLLDTILCSSIPERHPSSKNGKASLKGLTTDLGDRLRSDYNDSQVSAIAAAVGKLDLGAEAHQLALVQGPPGTGKTRTIVGIVSALLASEPQSSNISERNNMRVPSRNIRGISRDAACARAWQDAALAAQENGLGLGKAKETSMTRGGSRKRSILVCAQSNGAVDELVLRLCKEGLYDKHGDFFRPSLVRVGNVNTVHPASMGIFIDTVVEKRLAAEKGGLVDGNRQQRISILRRKLEEVIESIEELEASHAKEDAPDAPGAPENANPESAKRVVRVLQEGDAAVQGKLNMLYGQRRRLYAELRDAEKDEKNDRNEEWTKRKEMRRTVIREADVVLTTLSGCGGDVYNACMERFVPAKKFQPRKDFGEDDFFSAVVIDEAGQALEPATLIPLQLLKQNQARCVMVGDPKQLPATVLSTSLSRTNFEISMFERLQLAGYPVTMLNTQYRMHPEIRKFPSAHFYNNELTDGIAEGSRKARFHNEWCFAPYVFFDVAHGHERMGSSNSVCNDAEVDAALTICRTFQQWYHDEANAKSISVLTPYNQQRTLLQERFDRSLGSSKAFTIDFNTVDGYQGREVDIVIFSTVRANEGGARGNNRIGFVGDIRRMNVALTRARFSLWIVGNATTLQQDPHWGALISDAKMRQVFFPVKENFVLEPRAHLVRPTTIEAAQNIATPRSSDMGSTSSMERLSEAMDSEVSPRGVASLQESAEKRDTHKKLQHQSPPRMQRNNSIPRGERSMRTDEKDRISRRHPDGVKPRDGGGQERPRSKDDASSRRDARTESRGIQKPAEPARSSEKVRVDGQSRKADEARRSLSAEPGTVLRKPTRDPDSCSLKARPKVNYLDLGQSDKPSSGMKPPQTTTPVSQSGRSEDRNRHAVPSSGQRAGTRQDESPRGAPAPSKSTESEWEKYKRALHGNPTNDRVQSPRQGGTRPDSDAHPRRAGSDPRSNRNMERPRDPTAKRPGADNERSRSAHPPPPTKKQKVAGGSSSSAVRPPSNNPRASSRVDDILSGLGTLSRSQVIGSRVIEESLPKPNPTRHH